MSKIIDDVAYQYLRDDRAGTDYVLKLRIFEEDAVLPLLRAFATRLPEVFEAFGRSHASAEYWHRISDDTQKVDYVVGKMGLRGERKLVESLSSSNRNIRIAAAIFLVAPQRGLAPQTLSTIEQMMPSLGELKYEKILLALLSITLAWHGSEYWSEYCQYHAQKMGWSENYETRVLVFALQELSEPTS